MDATASALIARLRSHPDDLEAYEALKAHYHYGNDFASLANLVEGWAARSAEPRVAADAFHEAARTVSYYLQDQPRAVELLESALDRDPKHAEASADLEALLEALGDVNATIQSFERRALRLAHAGAEPTEIAAAHYRLGELWEKSLERPDKAVGHYRTAFELDPDHLPAMYATREIYRQNGDLRAAAQVYELEIAAERSTTRKILLLRELAHLLRDGLADLDGCVGALDRALEHEPRDKEVAYELAGALLTRAASRGDTPGAMEDRRHAAALLVRLAGASDGETQIAFLEAALDAAPDSDEALAQLEKLAPAARVEARLPIRWIRYVSLAPNGPNVAMRRGRLADAYEAANQLADAIACLEPLEAGNDPAITARLAQLRQKSGSPRAAQQTQAAHVEAPQAQPAPVEAPEQPAPVEAPREAPPEDRDARAKRKQALRLAQRWDELASILVWEATQESEAAIRRNAALSLDELTQRANLDPSRAVEGLVRVHADDPTEFVVRDRLVARLLEVGRFADALPLLDAKADEAPTRRDKAALLDQAATIREQLGDVLGAVASLEKWIEVEPENEVPHRRALSLSEQSEDANVLARALEREANRSTGEARARWLLRLADLQTNQLGSDSTAIETLKAATSAHDDDPAIRRAFEAALRRAGRYLELRESMNTRVSRESSEQARCDLLREIARLSETELSDTEGAADAYRRLRSIAEDAEALEWSIARARDASATDELVGLLEARFEFDADPARRTATALELATLLDRPGGNRARARAVLEAVRGIAPDEVPVLEHLARIHRAEGDSHALGAIWAELLEHTEDPRRAVELAKALHELAERTLGNETLVSRALFHWSKHAPSELAPLHALVSMHVRAGREHEAADALLELGKRLDSPSEAEAKLLEASSRYEAAGDLDAAMQATRLAQSLGFGSSVARERLGALAEQAGRHDVVLEVAMARAKEAASLRDGRESHVVELLRCAEIARRGLRDEARAQAFLLQASELAEGDSSLVARVEASASHIDRVVNDTDALLERALVKRLVTRAKEADGDTRVAHLTRAVRILSDAIGDFAEAYRLLAESTEEDANPELLELLVDVARRGALGGDLGQLLAARFEDCVEPEVARVLLEARASLYKQTGRASEEADVLHRLFTMKPTPEARDRLLDGLGRAGRHQDRVNVLEQSIRRAPADSAEKIELAKRVAHLFETDLANKLEAIDAWKRVARWAPGDPDVHAAFERLELKRASLIPAAARPQAVAQQTAPAHVPSVAPPRGPSVAPPRPPTSIPPPIPAAATRGFDVNAVPKAPRVPVEVVLVEDATDLAELDEGEELIEELEDVVAEPAPSHVRQYVSLPPPPPGQPSDRSKG